MVKQNPIRNVIGSLLALMLLGVYLSADLVGSLHSYFVHAEQIETVCSLENEQDACHRTIYHHDTVHGCKHKEHISIPVLKCELCSMLLTHHVLPSRKSPNVSHVIHVPVIQALEAQFFTNPTCVAHSLRGPPSFSYFNLQTNYS